MDDLDYLFNKMKDLIESTKKFKSLDENNFNQMADKWLKKYNEFMTEFDKLSNKDKIIMEKRYFEFFKKLGKK